MIRRIWRGGYIWLVFGVLTKALTQWGVLLVMTRLASPQTVGVYGLALSLVQPVVATGTLRLSQIQATDRSNSYHFLDYAGVRAWCMAASFAVILAISLFTDLATTTRWLVVAIGIRYVADASLEVFHGLFLREGQLALSGKGTAYSFSISFFFLTLVYLLWESLAVAFLVSVLALLVPFLLFYIPAAKRLVGIELASVRGATKEPSISSQRALLRLAAPMGGVILLESLAIHIPRYFVAAFAGSYDLGVLLALLTILSAGTLANDVLLQALIPRISSMSTRSRSELRAFNSRAIAAALVFSGLLAICAWHFGPVLIGNVFGPEYAQYRIATVGIAGLYGVQLITRILGISLTAIRVIDENAVVAAITIIVTLVASAVLVPSFGIEGAIITMAVAGLAQAGLFLVLLHRSSTAVKAGYKTHPIEVR